MNNFSLEGEIVHLDSLRFTPAGLPVLGMRIKHQSKQSEAALSKTVNLEIEAVVIGKLTETVFKLGDKSLFHGFLEKRSLKSNQIIFHITQINK